MANIFGQTYSKERLLQHVGDLSQFAGVRIAELADGWERGVRTADIRTGSGFDFAVLIDRGMDIGPASYRGASLAWRSGVPSVAPAFYDPQGAGWLRGFSGGLMVTCGLSTFGSGDVDEGEELGVHGRASFIPAERFSYGGDWEGEEYEMWVRGELREVRVFGEYLVLRRRISARLGESRLFLRDTVTNEGHRTVPHMLLYHCNFGFPLVSENAEWLSSDLEMRPRDAVAAAGAADYARMAPPTRDYREQVFYHVPNADANGFASAAILNRRLQGGLGAYVRFPVSELPRLVQWKQMGQTEYVCGLEPATNWVEGRAKERQEGRLQFLEPGEVREYHLEIGVLTNSAEIDSFETALPH